MKRSADWQDRRCNRRNDEADAKILRVSSISSATPPATVLPWYRWVEERSGNGVRALPHGWLDFCPLAEKGDCDVDQ
ncbi:hypothetical protein ACZ87_00548 [Candidatus Erwinia dacicola]|uniref:Uncharacterized protein n=1 Tax=Candidatus Erwinia dacicola TaxID=252393 RepID=A0A328TU77_9GAMM|nr:hypothetical protein ACZ87_00548 [Candidatus Erwinia dacicola]